MSPKAVPETGKSQVAFATLVNPASFHNASLNELQDCNTTSKYWVVNPQVSDGLGVIVIVGVTSGVGVLLGVIDGVFVGCAVGVGLG